MSYTLEIGKFNVAFGKCLVIVGADKARSPLFFGKLRVTVVCHTEPVEVIYFLFSDFS